MRFRIPSVQINVKSVLVFLILATSISSAQSAPPSGTATPRSVVEAYCNLDLNGARLDSQNPANDMISKLSSWRVEPGWDSLIAIRACEVIRESPGPNRSTVVVRYTVLGRLVGASVTSSREHTELVKFVLKRSHGRWLIEKPMIPPHVSPSAAQSALESLLSDEHDSKRIDEIHAAIAILNRWNRRGGQNALR